MPLETDLNVSPYFDDYRDVKDFYKILFRPGVAVQARELNQLQTMLQKQVERFGDNIFRRGTIVDGCNFDYVSPYQYVKINDLQKDGLAAIPSLYVGYFAKSVNTQVGVEAFVVNYEDGYESTDPDLKTLYLSYINSGANGSTNTFVAGENITIFSPRYPIFGVQVENGGLSFQNSDTVVVTSALVVNVTSGTFTNGEYLYQESTGANVQIIGIDTTTLASSNQTILKIAPRTTDLINASANSQAWTVSNSESVRNASSTVAADVEGIIGAGAEIIITTDSSGTVINVTVVNGGNDYTTLPYVTIKSANNSSGLSTLSLTPRNYYANVQVSTVSNSVGNGYAFSVGEGVIYQKGYFSRVKPQTIIVSKYDQLPNNVVVGFDTVESIVDSNIDTSLLDNALGTENENAPGANRLKLEPQLVIMSSEAAAANDSFFVLTEWSEGRPFRQNRQTAYNKLGDEFARRTSEESGNFSLNRFEVTTRSPANNSFEGNTFSIVVDPGLAYIDGYRVQTYTNYALDTRKGNDVETTNNQAITLDYGNYIRVTEVGGLFQFSTGDQVVLYNTAKQFLSNVVSASTGNTNPVGTIVGSARMRMMTHFDGVPGTNNAVYKLYLYDINMNTGRNFRTDVKSVYYNGTNKGVADVVLTLDGTTNNNVAVIEGVAVDKLWFYSGVYSMKSSANNTYTYRTFDQTLTVGNNTGQIVKDISSVIGEYYTTTGPLSDGDLAKIFVVPTSNSLTSYANIGGTVSVNTTSPNVIGTSTSFTSYLQSGDFIKIANSTANVVHRVKTVVNNTLLILANNGAMANDSAYVHMFYPQNVPIPLGFRVPGQTNHSANVDANGNILTIQMKYSNGTSMTFDSTTTVAANIALSVDIQRRDVTSLTKTAVRKAFVKIRPANNTTSSRFYRVVESGNGSVIRSAANTLTGTNTSFTTDFANGNTIELIGKFAGGVVANNASPANFYYSRAEYTIHQVVNNTVMILTADVPTVYNSGGIAQTAFVVKPGNINGPWCLGVPDAFRLRSVYIGNSSVDNTYPNAVSDFYIDPNQNSNYYDLSYLYIRPRSSVKIDADDYLLVEFDYGTASDGGFFNTVSYTGDANAAAVAAYDSLPLSNLTTKYNTWEIPEVYLKSGVYFDPISVFDFRPRVANTVAPNTTPSNAPINPTYSVSFGNTADPANDKKFPLPQSTFKSNIDQYLGRFDSVFIDRNSEVFLLEGRPGSSPNTAHAPLTPRYSMRLNDVVIKPYPNLPNSPTSDVREILNTRVANERNNLVRANDRLIRTTLSQREIREEQPRGYTMADIGNLDRRIEDLEYYVSLSLLESDMKDRVIPSSIDPTLNRFKYGFFVDDFSTNKYADENNPQYSATIESDDVLPDREIFTVTYPAPTLSCDYIDFAIVSQDNATTPAPPPPGEPPPPPQPNCQPSTITANNWIVRKQITTSSTIKGREEVDTVVVNMSSVAANVTLYAYFYSGADRIQIYQGNTILFQSNSAQALTATDKTKMLSNAVPQAWFKSPTDTSIEGVNLDRAFILKSDTRGTGVGYAFKIAWTHNPTRGLEYTIKTTKYTKIWRYALEYPVNSNTVTCNTTPNTTPTIYNGTMVVTPSSFDVKCFR